MLCCVFIVNMVEIRWLKKMMKNRDIQVMKCKWCGKEFKSEKTLAVHMCVKKRRFADKDMSHIRLSHRAFQMFYEINTIKKRFKAK